MVGGGLTNEKGSFEIRVSFFFLVLIEGGFKFIIDKLNKLYNPINYTYDKQMTFDCNKYMNTIAYKNTINVYVYDDGFSFKRSSYNDRKPTYCNISRDSLN